MNQVTPKPTPAPSRRSRVVRVGDRGHYDAATLHAILDAGYVCHVAFVQDGQPLVIPTAYWREGDYLYIHGSTRSRMAIALAAGIPASVAVTLLDGLVLARSAFHHSMNYRSVVAMGVFEKIPDDHKMAALEAFTERVAPGRWADIRAPNRQEMKGTMVLRLPLTEASAKIRSGPPKDDAEDMAVPAWAGVLPFAQGFAAPVPDPQLAASVAFPDYLRALTSR
ncbi:pyridoxamine 5'-phosphate oxidase family protein [Ferrovibrio sp.]|uniref:pyridoxamine 5'-phosphate oxidase family protein n=1 Tax=Ferrovibrio sp. TaxID=1917215 RepID=UPI000CC4469A|nr:pyridoxamine 5'-phosphate oxidase family protein [Ferrovibrio sp.]PJI43606.1 MAG: flavin-nucleotide-binding protein [Ferrovibrio sp.]